MNTIIYRRFRIMDKSELHFDIDIGGRTISLAVNDYKLSLLFTGPNALMQKMENCSYLL